MIASVSVRSPELPKLKDFVQITSSFVQIISSFNYFSPGLFLISLERCDRSLLVEGYGSLRQQIEIPVLGLGRSFVLLNPRVSLVFHSAPSG